MESLKLEMLGMKSWNGKNGKKCSNRNEKFEMKRLKSIAIGIKSWNEKDKKCNDVNEKFEMIRFKKWNDGNKKLKKV